MFIIAGYADQCMVKCVPSYHEQDFGFNLQHRGKNLFFVLCFYFADQYVVNCVPHYHEKRSWFQYPTERVGGEPIKQIKNFVGKKQL